MIGNIENTMILRQLVIQIETKTNNFVLFEDIHDLAQTCLLEAKAIKICILEPISHSYHSL